MNEAALQAARTGRDLVDMNDFEYAKDKIVMGRERRSLILSDEEQRITAYHEGGHAICTYYCKTQDKVHQVSIIPRGHAGGYTMSLPEKDKSYVSRSEMYENIVVLLGGRVAEKLILEDISTGASNDLERATSTARSMVTRYGFSERLGPVVYGNDEHQVFLGRDYASGHSYSENVAAEIDAEIREIIEDCFVRAEDILKEHTDQLHLVAKYLMHFEKIDSDEFYDHDDFMLARKMFDSNDEMKVSYCEYVNYYRDYQHLLIWPFRSYVPFITEIQYRFSFDNGSFDRPSDPTRRYLIPERGKYHIFPYRTVKMHHLSWIRINIERKIDAWSAKKYFENVS